MSLARVGLDARLTRQMSVGMTAYARELTARLPQVAPEYSFVRFSQGANFGWSEQVLLPLAMRRARLDLVHFLSVYVPAFAPRPFVVTIHDLIHLCYPQYFKAKVRPYYQTVVRLACARASRVITDDERTIGDLARFLHVDLNKIRVIPLGVDATFFREIAPYAAERPYVLYVGNHRRHKNLGTLFEAWAALPEEWPVDLYVTGPDDFGIELRRGPGATRRMVALGDVTPAQLAAYYAGAQALVQPSLREGFGLPVLEAMAAGCPVIASETAIPGILAPSALTFEPRDAQQLRALLERVIDDQGTRERLVNLGLQAARELTWDRCARATADVYREVLEPA